MLGAFGQIILAAVILGLIWWAYTQLIPLAKLQGALATIVNVVVVVAIVIAVLWYVVIPLFAILINMLEGNFRHEPHGIHLNP